MLDERKDDNRRLGIIREASGMVVVLDGFSRTDFAEQLKKFREELLFADLEVVSNRVPKVEAGLKKAKPAKEREADEAELALLRRSCWRHSRRARRHRRSDLPRMKKAAP